MKRIIFLTLAVLLFASCDKFSQSSNPLAGTVWESDWLPNRLDFRDNSNVEISFKPRFQQILKYNQSATGKYTVVGNTVTFKKPIVLTDELVLENGLERMEITFNGAQISGEELIVYYDLGSTETIVTSPKFHRIK